MVDDGGPHSLYCPPACMCVVMAVQRQGPDTGEIDLNNDEEKSKIKTRQQRESWAEEVRTRVGSFRPFNAWSIARHRQQLLIHKS